MEQSDRLWQVMYLSKYMQNFRSWHFWSWHFESWHFWSWHFGSWHFGSWHFGKNPSWVVAKSWRLLLDQRSSQREAGGERERETFLPSQNSIRQEISRLTPNWSTGRLERIHRVCLGKMVLALLGAHPSFVAQNLQEDTYSCKVATTDCIIINNYAGRRVVYLDWIHNLVWKSVSDKRFPSISYTLICNG